MRLAAWCRSFVRTIVRARALDAEIDAELASAVAELAAEYRRRGESPEAAERRARLALGGVAQVRERVRDVRVGAWVDTLLGDLRYAARTLIASPGFSVAVIATFALAVGANSAIFSVVNQLLLAPLPYRDAERLVFIWSDLRAAGYPRAPLAAAELKDLRDRTTLFEGLGAIWSNTTAFTGDDKPEQLRIGLVTANFFSVLGTAPALGRDFNASDEEPGTPPPLMLSWSLFERRFGADPAIVGTKVEVDGAPTTVVGVMPRDFRLWFPLDSSVPDDLQAWRAFPRTIVNGSRGQQYLRVIGRLRSGASLAAANAEVAAIGRQIGREFSVYTTTPAFSVVSLHADGVRDVRPTLLAVVGGVVLLLVLAAVNIANLFISRASKRHADLVLRMSLGASRARLLQHWLAEGVWLGLAGGIAALLVARGVLDALLWLRPAGLNRVSATLDVPVLLVTMALALGWAMVVSLAPVVTIGRLSSDVGFARGNAGARVAGGPRELRLRRLLVAAQIALSLTLLIAAGLLARAYVQIHNTPLGFTTSEALTFRFSPPRGRYRTPSDLTTFEASLRHELMNLHGVRAVGGISHLPYDSIPNWSTPYIRVDAPAGSAARDADARTITPGALAAMGAILLEGRDVTDADQRGSVAVAIVDERLADRTWPGESALGKQLRADPGTTGTAGTVVEVVGVIAHMRHRSPTSEVREQIYFAQRQVLRLPMTFVVATDTPGTIAADVARVVRQLDPQLPIYDVRPLSEYMNRARSVHRFIAILAGAFSTTAVGLAAVGIYGVLAYSVGRRRREIAIRLAVGARPLSVLRLVLQEAFAMSAAGALIGALGALGAATLLEAQLYQVSPYDPSTYVGGALVVTLCVGAASLGPSVRAVGVQAVESLKE
jgi:predicted permease